MSEAVVQDLKRIKKCNPIVKELAGRVGATIAGVKPAEILNINTEEVHRVYKDFFNKSNKLSIRIIKQDTARTQVFIYHNRCLKESLHKRGAYHFLKWVGYPARFSLNTYVEHLLKRLRDQSFPHEIGVFLGYPLKDVYGYMGIAGLPHKKTMGWKMYGDTTVSERRYHHFRHARDQVRSVLTTA